MWGEGYVCTHVCVRVCVNGLLVYSGTISLLIYHPNLFLDTVMDSVYVISFYSHN